MFGNIVSYLCEDSMDKLTTLFSVSFSLQNQEVLSIQIGDEIVFSFENEGEYRTIVNSLQQNTVDNIVIYTLFFSVESAFLENKCGKFAIASEDLTLEANDNSFFIHHEQTDANYTTFKDNVINMGIESAFDFARNDFYFSNDENGFFQTNDDATRECLRKAVIFAYFALICAQSSTDTLQQFETVINNIVNGVASTDIVLIQDVSFSANTVITLQDITDIFDTNADFCPPFHIDDTAKTYITQSVQVAVIKAMSGILRNCPGLHKLNRIIHKTGDNRGDNAVLPLTSLFSMCKHVLDAMIFYSEFAVAHQMAKITIDEPLTVSGANLTFSFAEQIPSDKEYYMLVPYPDIIDPQTAMPNSLSYLDYGAPILQSLNHLLKIKNGKSVINEQADEVLYYKDKFATAMNRWITNTKYLLISDTGRYYGTSIYASPSELYRHYIQTINSSLIGSPFANIINNTDGIKANIEAGMQANSTVNRLGKQLVDNVMQNVDMIGRSILASDPSRASDMIYETNSAHGEYRLFRKGDMITIFVAISGTIGNMNMGANGQQINIGSVFARNVDPYGDNASSFKRYIINHTGDRIKPLIYAILVPVIDDEISELDVI
jgi:hypothetical protein